MKRVPSPFGPRLSRLAALAPIALALGLPPAFAQDTGAATRDPIAAALDAGSDSAGAAKPVATKPVATKPAATKSRNFSAKDISDLLTQERIPGASTVVAPAEAASVATDQVAPPAPPRAPITLDAINAVGFSRVSETSRAIDPVVLKAEILLDRAHAPPGVIDGRYGSNFVKAVKTFQEVRGLEVDGKLTRQVWNELGGDTAAPVFGTYTITPADVAGPFYPDLSLDYADQATLPDLGYRGPDEMFGERFHMDKRFLKAMNPDVDMSIAGNHIVVAEVETLPVAAQIARLDVDKGKGQVLAYDADGLLVLAYPATIGSEELPSPSGSYVVRGIAPHPTYTYDPKKNFQQGNNTQKLILPPGPNNPVGAAFIALSKPTYGIHGTPDPSKIDKTHSHGCVRLTNWNAQELARLVTVGTPVNFIDKPGAPPPEPDIATLAADPAPR